VEITTKGDDAEFLVFCHNFMRLSLGAKVRRNLHSHNRTFVAFYIPLIWYAIYHRCGIVVLAIPP
ncbi:MAG: hypothetical protein IJ885_02340, partial [Prevotella sp.]|nr:hypothetical protein [Prevotella sp.]